MRTFYPLISKGDYGFISPIIPDVDSTMTPDKVRELEESSRPEVKLDVVGSEKLEITYIFPGCFTSPNKLTINDKIADFVDSVKR
jgi:hypothetical protein